MYYLALFGSVDVVEMDSLTGPHHRHPNGEIDLIMPPSPSAKFGGRGAGFLVYAAGGAHSPTVTAARRSCSICCPKARSSSPGRA